MTSGHAFIIDTVLKITKDAAGELWLDVELKPQSDVDRWCDNMKHFQCVGAPTSRTEASIACRHVIAAVEMNDG